MSCRYLYNMAGDDCCYAQKGAPLCYCHGDEDRCDCGRADTAERLKRLYDGDIDKYECVRCGMLVAEEFNYCPHCGYEYNEWDGETLA